MARSGARSIWMPFAVGFLTVGASVVLWQRLLHQERAEIRRMTGSQALFVKNKTEAELKARILPLNHLARRWEVRGEPPELEGESDAALVMSGYRGYQAIEWVDENLRVRWVAPRAGNKLDLNADLGVLPAVRATFGAAEDTHRILATHPIELRQGGRGFLIWVPIYPAQKFGGFLTGVFQYEELLYAILEDVARDYWVTVYEGEEQIYSRSGTNTPREEEEEQWTQEVPMHVAQLDW